LLSTFWPGTDYQREKVVQLITFYITIQKLNFDTVFKGDALPMCGGFLSMFFEKSIASLAVNTR